MVFYGEVHGNKVSWTNRLDSSIWRHYLRFPRGDDLTSPDCFRSAATLAVELLLVGILTKVCFYFITEILLVALKRRWCKVALFLVNHRCGVSFHDIKLSDKHTRTSMWKGKKTKPPTRTNCVKLEQSRQLLVPTQKVCRYEFGIPIVQGNLITTCRFPSGIA
jgi:hypothetical protein